ncbi:unnamed protein product [Prorocentrum cordatum]|uniref:2'-phosphotransferase n=1 Tax=Prorocentrum cordatum TaxID=2364126 RepID=A0ABN9SY26_9DINO|nr:unnamed protein product [Polarella glacialis]CAK0866876.1 unnamed protein product [Polarella glacialis]
MAMTTPLTLVSAAVDELQELKKFIVYICRHGAADWGLQWDKDGWFDCNDILGLQPLRDRKWTDHDLQAAVQNDQKGRLQLEDLPSGASRVRAAQGHTLPVSDDSYEQVTSWDGDLIHGTFDNSWEAIAQHGLHPMGRNRVHMMPTLDGVRPDSTILIYIDTAKWFRAGRKFLKASNGVFLTRTPIEVEYFSCVWHVREKRGLLKDLSEIDKPHVMMWSRVRQVELGMRTVEYQSWLHAPKEIEEAHRGVVILPPGPNDRDLSKRQFLRDLSAWMRSLHRFKELLDAAMDDKDGAQVPLKKPKSSGDDSGSD